MTRVRLCIKHGFLRIKIKTKITNHHKTEICIGLPPSKHFFNVL